MDVKAFLEAVWQNHRGKLVGTILGSMIGISILLFGFFKTVFIMICGLIGLFVGKRVDDKDDLMDIVEKIIPSGFKR
ncbi:DUF2273 domain-containing protein [Anaerosinus massiliensis]|uniref:DUF2273 domain-containing protein n=1 Tax=Massilibacillus massiliensis TaxID=1806837 RepID=UPI000DA61CFE|nr:DUF2273 domain-containing protein [Massilibacillus massiliensis]